MRLLLYQRFERKMLPVKVYFEEEKEFRRFNLRLDEDRKDFFTLLHWKIAEVLGHDLFRIYWKDFEGDAIACESEEELQVALLACQDTLVTKECAGSRLFRLFVKTDINPRDKAAIKERGTGYKPAASCARPSSEAYNHFHGKHVHQRVVCDGCDGSIAGTRFKCLTCDDHDLCEKCEGKGLHSLHDSLAIRNSDQGQWRVPHRGYYSIARLLPPSGPMNLFAVRHVAYRSQSGIFIPHIPRMEIFTQHQEGKSGWAPPHAQEIHGNPQQPLENLLKDVTFSVQKVLKGFLPTSIPEVPVMAPVVSAPLFRTEPSFFHSKPTEVKTETCEETVNELHRSLITSSDNDVEVLHETVTERAIEKPEEKAAVECIYPSLITASEHAAKINFAESRRSESPTVSAGSEDVENGWAYLNAEENVSMDATTETEAEAVLVNHDKKPGEQIETALKAMEAMGFTNEGNLLRALLENFEGDIGKVLDTIAN